MSPVKEEQMTTLEKKIQHFSRILANRPGDELTVLALAEASFRRGLKLEALTAYQEVGSRAVPEAHLAVAEIYSDQGMPNEAYGELRRLFELDPENVEARLLVNSLQADVLAPDDLRERLESSVSDDAIEIARLRLKIQRSIYNRELQERTRNVTLEPGTVIHEYHMEEAKKKLIRVDELLRELDRFREHNANLAAEPPRAETVSPEPELGLVEMPAVEWTDELPGEGDGLEFSQDAEFGILDVGEPSQETPEDSTSPLELDTEIALSAVEEEAGEETISSFGLEMAPLSMAAVEEASGESYSSSEFGLESPVDPDLPELESEEPEQGAFSAPFVDLEPIEMSGETGDMISLDIPESTFRDTPPEEEAESENSLMPIVDEPTVLPESIDESPEENGELNVSDISADPEVSGVEPDSATEDEEIDAGPVLGGVDPQAAREFSAARKAFYEAHSESLSGLTTTLARTRGVTSIFLVAREGLTIDSAAKDDISELRVGELVRESFEFLEAFAKDPAYWVLECAGGIFVMQKLDERHVLIAIGQAGANFGALRYTMDKTRTKFEQLLSQAPD